jgi:uncharacterized protein
MRAERNGRRPHGRTSRLHATGPLLVVALAAFAMPAMGQDVIPIQRVPVQDLVTVTGTAEVKGTPDMASIQLGVESNARTASEATKTETTLMSAVVAAVRKTGIPETDIRTTQLTLQPITENGTTINPPPVLGFDATNIIQVIVHNPTNLGPLLDAALAAGANRVENIDFQISNDEELRMQALAKAAAEAHQKAELLATVLGIALTGAASVTEGTSGPIQPFAGRMMAMAAPQTPVSPGQITITGSVTLQYHIGGMRPTEKPGQVNR